MNERVENLLKEREEFKEEKQLISRQVESIAMMQKKATQDIKKIESDKVKLQKAKDEIYSESELLKRQVDSLSMMKKKALEDFKSIEKNKKDLSSAYYETRDEQLSNFSYCEFKF